MLLQLNSIFLSQLQQKLLHSIFDFINFPQSLKILKFLTPSVSPPVVDSDGFRRRGEFVEREEVESVQRVVGLVVLLVVVHLIHLMTCAISLIISTVAVMVVICGGLKYGISFFPKSQNILIYYYFFLILDIRYVSRIS